MEQGRECGSWPARSSWQTPRSHIHAQINWEEQNRPHNLGAPGQRNKASNQIENPLEVEAAAGETPSLTGELVGETHRVPEHTQAHAPRKQHQKSPI